ncbi:toxin 3FTx-Psa1-like [Erythrolamprus reginae]|uniref:toxin 3FTx-Psa1-like n=1 Tax=Erythrolamprus reginae TaxID=121349 RepID=UPI00396CA14E
MKTLLLSLVVVAFVYLDSGRTIKCYTCNAPICIASENCTDATACYVKRSGILGLNVVKGCANNCTFPESGETIKYCVGDNCNQ